MSKKYLVVASVLASGAIVSGIALADTSAASTYCKPGFYAGIQAGRGDTYYQTNDVLNGVLAGYYSNFGGYSLNSSVASNVDDTAAAGRIFGGYQFNPYFAAEMGYTQFGKTSYFAVPYNPANGNNDIVYKGEVTQRAFDLSGKLTMPFEYGFGAYLKAGAAVITADQDVTAYAGSGTSGAAPLNNANAPIFTTFTKSYQAVVPVYGAGLDYTIPETGFDIDISYTQTGSTGGIPKTSLAALGVNYKFA